MNIAVANLKGGVAKTITAVHLTANPGEGRLSSSTLIRRARRPPGKVSLGGVALHHAGAGS